MIKVRINLSYVVEGLTKQILAVVIRKKKLNLCLEIVIREVVPRKGTNLTQI